MTYFLCKPTQNNINNIYAIFSI